VMCGNSARLKGMRCRSPASGLAVVRTVCALARRAVACGARVPRHRGAGDADRLECCLLRCTSPQLALCHESSRDCSLKDKRNQFECSILYRLLLSMGAHYLVIEPLSQGDRAFNSTYPPEPIRVSVTLVQTGGGQGAALGLACPMMNDVTLKQIGDSRYLHLSAFSMH
jgi:hypothetical protein